jgi:hypothetical protein
MNRVLKGAFVALGLTGLIAGASLTTAGTASARAIVSLDLGNIAFGYNDGYWDRKHHWHHWRNQNDANSYRGAAGSQYHDWAHDRDPDHGWHD